MITFVTNLLGVLLLPWIFIGTIARVKAKWAGRRGSPLIQPLFDAIKLLRKERMASRTTSLVFAVAPIVSLIAVTIASGLVPGPTGQSVVSFSGDLVLFAYLLALARFLGVISALDTGSSFEGMGASREALLSTIVEPGLFILVASLLLASGGETLSELSSGFSLRLDVSSILILLSFFGLYLMILVEGHRVPIDDPATHLELTMIHEVMVLDYSGPELAMINYTSGLKMYLFAAIGTNVLLPRAIPTYLHLLLFVATVWLIGVSIGVVESWMARLRISHLPQFVFLINVSGMLLFFLTLLGVQS